MDVQINYRRSIWSKCRATLASIIGFYLLAWLCFTIHHTLFQYLNLRIIVRNAGDVDFKSTTIPQAYVTTVSLVLVTVFRAALVASVTTCYTQFLWRTFRQRSLKVQVIEDLFQVHGNAFRLANNTLLRNLPALTAIVAFCWLVPVAMIFPPGALVVGIGARSIALNSTVSSFMNANNADAMMAKPDKAGYIHDFIATYKLDEPNSPNRDVGERTGWRDSCSRDQIDANLRNMVDTTLVNGEIRTLDRHFGENATYTFEFWGPHLKCNTTVNRVVETSITEGGFPDGSISGPTPDAFYLPEFGVYDKFYFASYNTHNHRRIVHKELYTIKPCPSVNFRPKEARYPKISATMEYEDTECWCSVVKYMANIAYSKGIQHVTYMKTNETLSMSDNLSYQGFNGTFTEWVRMNDALALYSAFRDGFPLAKKSRQGYLPVPTNDTTYGSFMTENGTLAKTCDLEFTTINATNNVQLSGLSALQVFELRAPEGTNLRYDEAFLNEALVNVTISALSLNKWYGPANGTETRIFNVYRFKNKTAFFVPYALSLFLAIPIAVIGLVSMHQNGVTAITGGFLQVLMTTSGQTSLWEAAQKCSLGGQENISKELEEMEIRFGELIEDEEASITEEISSDQTSVIKKQVDSDESTVASFPDTEHSQKSSPSIEEISQHSHSSTPAEKNLAMASSLIETKSVRRRAGFGTMEETRPLRRE